MLSELCCTFYSYSARGRRWKKLSTIVLSLSLCLTLKRFGIAPLRHEILRLRDVWHTATDQSVEREKWQMKDRDERGGQNLPGHTLTSSIGITYYPHFSAQDRTLTWSHNTCTLIYTWVISTMLYILMAPSYMLLHDFFKAENHIRFSQCRKVNLMVKFKLLNYCLITIYSFKYERIII